MLWQKLLLWTFLQRLMYRIPTSKSGQPKAQVGRFSIGYLSLCKPGCDSLWGQAACVALVVRDRVDEITVDQCDARLR